MRNVKLLNGLLWVFNLLLGAGIVVFAMNVLVFPKGGDLLARVERTLEEIPVRPTMTDPMTIAALPNPLVPFKAAETAQEIPFTAKVIGADAPGSGQGSVFLLVGGKTCFAMVGEEATDVDGTLPELRGWILTEVTRQKVVFVKGARRVEVPVEEGSATGAVGAGDSNRKTLEGMPYDPTLFTKSQLLSQDPMGGQHWALDPMEVKWIIENFDAAINRDFTLALNAGGGITVTGIRAGESNAWRGVQVGDVIKSINNFVLSRPEDIATIRQNPAFRQSMGITLMVDRAGQQIQFQYSRAK